MKHNHRKEDIYFDHELNAWIINDAVIAKDILKNPSFTAFRKSEQIESIHTSQYNKDVMKEFYNHWLMYQKEGIDHTNMKRSVQRALNQSIARLSKSSVEASRLSLTKEQINVVNDISVPFLYSYLPRFYGISKSDYKKLLDLGVPLIDYIMLDNQDADEIVKSIQNTRKYLIDLINKKKLDPNGFVSKLLKEAGQTMEVIDILLNMIIDGHRPFLSSVNALIYHTLNHKDMTFKVKDVLREYPPFPYIRRECVNNTKYHDVTIKEDQHVLLMIQNMNRDMNRYGLTFGHGIHYCLGVVIVTLGLERLYKQLDVMKDYTIKEYKWSRTFSFNELTILDIEKRLP